MDLNTCGLPTLEGFDHANPASIRTLAEAVDTQYQAWSNELHQYKYPDTVCLRPVGDSTFGVTSSDNPFDFGSLQFCSWNPATYSTFRPGIWMFGCTITVLNFTGAGISGIRATLKVSDYRTPSLVTPTVTSYICDGYRCARGEENLNLSGLVELMNPPQVPFVPYLRLWGAGTADMSAVRTYFWAARVRGNS